MGACKRVKKEVENLQKVCGDLGVNGGGAPQERRRRPNVAACHSPEFIRLHANMYRTCHAGSPRHVAVVLRKTYGWPVDESSVAKATTTGNTDFADGVGVSTSAHMPRLTLLGDGIRG